jgi:hypothetical protein
VRFALRHSRSQNMANMPPRINKVKAAPNRISRIAAQA